MNMVGVSSDSKVRNQGVWKRFIYLIRLAKVPWLGIVLYLAISMGTIYIAIMLPQVNGNFFAGDASVSNVLTVIGLEMASGLLLQASMLANGIVGGKIDRNFRNAIWKKILHLQPKYFEEISANTLLSRIINDAESMKELILNIIVSEITGISTMIATVAAMASMDVKLALIMAVFILVVMVVGFLVGRLKMKVGNILKFKMAELTDYLSGQLARIRVIKAYNCQEYESIRGDNAIEEYYIAERKTKIVEFIQYILDAIVGMGPSIALIIIGINLLDKKVLTVAEWVAFHSYALGLVIFFQSKSGTWISIKEKQGCLNRLSELFNIPEEGAIPYIKEIVESGDIIFDNVSFSYGNKKILKDVSLSIPQKAFTAIIGPSGTGKTTILKLLEQIYYPTAGRILLSGHELKDYKLENWRSEIGYVKQDTPMFSGTIRENILYGVGRVVSDEEIMEAAREVRAVEFINNCPEGLDHQVGQFGDKLSGGQRQKISILRAFLQNREYMILDEPTASLDAISAYEVVQSIEQLKNKRTVIMVAHDMNLIKYADHIIVCDEKLGVFEGTIEEVSKISSFLKHMSVTMDRGEFDE